MDAPIPASGLVAHTLISRFVDLRVLSGPRVRSTRWPSWVQRKGRQVHRWRTCRHGKARWCVTNTPGTSPSSTNVCTRSASPRIASRMPDENSTNSWVPIEAVGHDRLLFGYQASNLRCRSHDS